MPLRCLLFSSDEELVPTIWQVLSDLGIDGEYCRSAVEAVERVTTQLFQIVITDWDDQPEAEFLLKTARDQKAATRPLTLAIVKDDASLPTALQAGANSILRKPLVVDQVRDTLSSARDLLRAKQESSKPVARQAAATADAAAFAATAGAGAAASVPAAVTKAPEPFRAGDFLQPASSDLSRQFDTEPETTESVEQAAVAEIDPLGELEPMAAAVEAVPEEPPQKGVKDWAAVQAHLPKLGPPVTAPAAKTELLPYEETPSHSAPAAPTVESDASAPAPAEDTVPETKAEAELFAYLAGESPKAPEPEAAPSPNPMRRLLVFGAFAAVIIVAGLKIPVVQQSVGQLYASIVHVGRSWLNPQTVSPPQAPAQHETFGQAGDEYKLPVARNIPDATGDSSQIRVLPVIDPTAKPGNGSATGGGQTPLTDPPAENGASDPGKTGQSQVTEQTSQNPGISAPPAADPSPRPSSTASSAPAGPAQTNLPVRVEASPQRPATLPQRAPQLHPSSAGSNAAIPSSLKSQMASLTPDASGTKPAEAALPSIQPVDLPEAAARSLLLQQADPVYPEAAKSKRQQGSVVLQVLIGADGTVRDAKFLQGSLVFARAAIDAVRQWRFRPYLLNGRAAPAQTLLTLNFRPPA